jgi:hypothetical protein
VTVIDPKHYPITPASINLQTACSRKRLQIVLYESEVLASGTWLLIRMAQNAGTWYRPPGFRLFTRRRFRKQCRRCGNGGRTDEFLNLLLRARLVVEREGEFHFTHELLSACFQACPSSGVMDAE